VIKSTGDLFDRADIFIRKDRAEMRKQMILAAGAAAAAAAGHRVYTYGKDEFIKFAGRDDSLLKLTPETCRTRDREYIKQYFDAREEMKDRKYDDISIFSDDGLKLCGRLYKSRQKADKVVIAVHGFHSGGMYEMARFHSMYDRAGCDFLIISQRAHEESEGMWTTFGYKESGDIAAWCEKLVDIYGHKISIVLHGVSMGASAVLIAAGSGILPENVKACIADSAFDDMTRQSRYFLRFRGMTDFKIGISIAVLNRFGARLAGFTMKDVSPVNAVRTAKIPALIIHGAADDFVPPEMADSLDEAYGGPHKEILFPGAGHAHAFLTDPHLYERNFDDLISTINQYK
jgi:fermentation-respiration switch protein FrsA (DUF1100 family)